MSAPATTGPERLFSTNCLRPLVHTDGLDGVERRGRLPRRSRRRQLSSPIGIPSVINLEDDDGLLLVIDLVAHAVLFLTPVIPITLLT